MKVKEESEKAGLDLNIQKTKIMASSPITSWQIKGAKVKAVNRFSFLRLWSYWSGDSSHEIKRRLLLGRRAMTNLDYIKKQRHHSANKGLESQFPVVMYRCESWTIKKAEHWRNGASELWCWMKKTLWEPRGLQGDWTSQSSRESILSIHWKDWGWNSNTSVTFAKSRLIGKDHDAGKDWRQEEKVATGDEMAG